MTADQGRDSIKAALAAHLGATPKPTIRVLSASVTDALCSFCGDTSAVALRWSHPRCEAAHGAVVCGCASILDAGGRCGDTLASEDKAQLRQAAHRIARLRGAA